MLEKKFFSHDSLQQLAVGNSELIQNKLILMYFWFPVLQKFSEKPNIEMS